MLRTIKTMLATISLVCIKQILGVICIGFLIFPLVAFGGKKFDNAAANSMLSGFQQESSTSLKFFKGTFSFSSDSSGQQPSNAKASAGGKNALCGFLNQKPEAYINPKLFFDLRKFFSGDFEGWGVACDTSQRLRDHFYIIGKVTINDQKHVKIEEDLYYGSGKEEFRVWEFNFINDHEFIANGTDVLTPDVKGVQNGNTTNMRYDFLVPVSGRLIMQANVDNWRYMIDDNTFINRLFLYKFGLRVGELLVVFKRKSQN